MSLLVHVKGGEASASVQPKMTWSRVQSRSSFGPVLHMRHWRLELWLCPRFVAKMEINCGLQSSRSAHQLVHQPFCQKSLRIWPVTEPYRAVWLEWSGGEVDQSESHS